MFDFLTDLVGASSWTYLLVFGVAALDAVLPFVPSETIVIAAGVLAASHDLDIALVLSPLRPAP